MERDVSVTAFCFIMMYTDDEGRKKVDGNGKEVYHKRIGTPFEL
jgi:hypothetical protein